MSPAATSRAQARRQRSMIISFVAVIVISLGAFAAVVGAKWTPKLGLDLAGGFTVVYQPVQKHVSQSDLNETVAIMNNRVNGLGVSGAQVSTSGDEIQVSVPGVSDATQVLNEIGNTAQLFFRPALCYAPSFTKPAKGTPALSGDGTLPTCSSADALTESNLDVTPNTADGSYTSNNQIGADSQFANYRSTDSNYDEAHRSADVILPGLPGSGFTGRYVLGPAELTGAAVKSAQAQEDNTGAWVVNYTLTSAGSPKWDAFAQQYFHQIIAIDLDGVVQSAPIIQPDQSTFTSFDGTGEISGGSNFTENNAKQLAIAINFGALPIRLKQLTTQTVSPTLGRSTLKAGLGAGLVGLLLVLLYTVFYYRVLGAVVLAGLGLTAALLWAIISSLGHTAIAPSFDLAGVTGLIVSIGITVDSYIVYFERLKDEARSGRTVRTSVDRGFKSAFRTVVAADSVSFIAALLLYIVAVGDVRGFAFFLGLSTILDVFVTYFFTRPLVIYLGRNERVTDARVMGIARGLNIKEVGA